VGVGSALSPVPPFSQNVPRLRLAAVVAPLLLLSFTVNSAVIFRSLTFGVGFGMFGQPVIEHVGRSRFKAWLHSYPHWMRMLDPRKFVAPPGRIRAVERWLNTCMFRRL
jgi:hypothetical protein